MYDTPHKRPEPVILKPHTPKLALTPKPYVGVRESQHKLALKDRSRELSPYVPICESPRSRVINLLGKSGLGIVALLLSPVLASVGSTFSYFADTEGSEANLFASLSLDLIVDYDLAQCISIDEGGEAWLPFTIETTGDNNLTTLVDLSLEVVGESELCSSLMLRVRRDGEQVYFGELMNLEVQGLEPGGEWAAEIDYSEGEIPDDIPWGAKCEADIVVSGYCARAGLFAASGFSDEERIPIRLAKAKSCLNCHHGDIDVTIINENNATITNTVTQHVSTGGNSANGGNGGDGGAGGSVTGSSTGNAGNGGDGGDGGEGGTIVSGSSSASVTISQTTNTNTTEVTVSSCGCDTCDPCGDPCEDEPCASDAHTDDGEQPDDGLEHGEENNPTKEEDEAEARDLIDSIHAEVEDRMSDITDRMGDRAHSRAQR